MIELKGITKSFANTQVLGPIDLDIPAGETTVLIGPSGCGKSTLLRIMIGLIPPDTGAARFEGTIVNPETSLTIRRKMGYVIQEGGLFPHLTAHGNVTLMARHLGWPSARVEKKVDELAALTQFPQDGLDRYPAQLSGGQRQRVSLMRALMLDPHVLLFDEPLGALDPMIRADLQNDLKQIFQTLKKTVVMVTHDIGEAGFLGDRLVLLRHGQVVQKGTIHDLVNKPEDPFVTSFINAQRSPLETLQA
ncbi:MAG: ATP-binding cassette domain-containing protein [Phycisphaerales bacterium]|nr:ATP-binding cassette domain-containing protein [Phycisphaerales bacterium]